MLTRDQAFVLIKKYIKDQDNIKHALAVEAILRKMAELLEKDEELWGLTGLLFNLDYEYSSGNPEERGMLAAQLLTDLLPENGINAIKANNYMHTDYIPITSLDKSLIATVAGVGLIFTIARSIPSKKIGDIDLSLALAKFNNDSFAKRYNRKRILLCEDIGMQLDFFLNLCLEVMKEIPK